MSRQTTLTTFRLGINQVRGATFSTDRVYRYHLWRTLDALTPGKVVFLMLNPSTADENIDDPTIKRCIQFTKDWGCGRMDVLNLFALRSTDPRGLKFVDDPVGPLNDDTIIRVTEGADYIVAAWGVHGTLKGRNEQVIHLLRGRGLMCLATTKDGHPNHPLYLKKNLIPRPMP